MVKKFQTILKVFNDLDLFSYTCLFIDLFFLVSWANPYKCTPVVKNIKLSFWIFCRLQWLAMQPYFIFSKTAALLFPFSWLHSYSQIFQTNNKINTNFNVQIPNGLIFVSTQEKVWFHYSILRKKVQLNLLKLISVKTFPVKMTKVLVNSTRKIVYSLCLINSSYIYILVSFQ